LLQILKGAIFVPV